MSNKSNNNIIGNDADAKINNNKAKNENLSKDKDNKSSKPFNVIFYCETCKRIPLLIFSEKNPKIVRYCDNDKKTELINPSNLLGMINVKHAKKKDASIDNLNFNENYINSEEFLCVSHGKEFINYCEDCSKNICYSCSKEHFRHQLIHFSHLIPSNKDIREGNKILAEMKRDLEKFKTSTKEIIKICDSLIYVKEVILNNLKLAIDFKKLNFYSILNYRNLLKTKIKLIEKPYTIINPLSEINSKILKSIQKNFEISLHEDNTNINKDINTLSQSYKNFMDIINESFELNKDDNNININKTEIKNDFFKEKNINIKNKIPQENISNNNNSVNNYLNLYIKNDITIPFINNSTFGNMKNIQNKILDLPISNNTSNNTAYNNYNQSLSYFSKDDKSSIMNINDINFIINLISTKLNQKIKKLYLCYRASTEGDSAEIFHKKCDFFKNIIILIKTKNKKKFGGFSTESWEANAENPIYKKDKEAFIFSLDNYKYYNIIKAEKALFCGKKLGPVFGLGEIFIPDKFFKFPSHCKEKEVYKYLNLIGNENIENNGPLSDEKEFFVEEIEVYKVDF